LAQVFRDTAFFCNGRLGSKSEVSDGAWDVGYWVNIGSKSKNTGGDPKTEQFRHISNIYCGLPVSRRRHRKNCSVKVVSCPRNHLNLLCMLLAPLAGTFSLVAEIQDARELSPEIDT